MAARLEASPGQPGGRIGGSPLSQSPCPGDRRDAYSIAAVWWPFGQRVKAKLRSSSSSSTLLTLGKEQSSSTPKVDEPGVARVTTHDRRVGVVAQDRLIHVLSLWYKSRVCGLWKMSTASAAALVVAKHSRLISGDYNTRLSA